ncbi:MAG: hypothetical protein ACTHKQ_12705 [Mesorhizobium sp.]
MATTHLVGIGYLEKFVSDGDSFGGPSYSFRVTEAGQTELLRSYRALMQTEFENLRIGRHLDMEEAFDPDADVPF